jgi:DNA-binding MarR family transcriptional regulator
VNEHPALVDDVPLGRRLAFTGKALRRLTDATLLQHGADMNTWIVLNAARHHAQVSGAASSQRELAEGLHMSGPALVRHLDRLEGEGLVQRQRDAHDRRVTRISLTPKGRRLQRRLEGVVAAYDEQVRACLTTAEARTLERALDKLRAYAEGALTTGPEERDERA